MPRRHTIPLWLVFTLQSLIVAGAFIAVILVLVLQQQSQFKTMVFEKIGLQLQLAETALVGPLLTREKIFQQLVDRLEADPSLRMQAHNNISSPNIQLYLNLTAFNIFSDPLAYTLYQHRMHPTKRLPANSTNGPLYFGITSFANEFLAGISNYDGTATVAPNPRYPMQYTATVQADLEISILDWSNLTRHAMSTQWIRPGVFVNPITGFVQLSSALVHPIEFDTSLGVATLSVGLTILSKYLVDSAKSSLLTPNSRGLLLELIEPTNNFIIAGIQTDAPDFEAATENLYTTSSFPDQAIVSDYFATTASCNVADNCTFYAEEHDSEIRSLIFMTTQFGYRMHLFQITPRDHYFSAGEKSAVVGITIGVIAAIVVLMSCVVIWFAVRGPVRRLRHNMELAAIMRNDDIEDTSSILTELDLLSNSFTQMNGKLLQARAFMPQSMLVHSSSDGGDEEDDVVSEGSAALGESESKLGGSAVSSGARSAFTNYSINDDTNTNISSSVPTTPTTPSTRRVSALPGTPISKGGLMLKKVGVLMINARGTHKLAMSTGAANLEREQVRLVELVERCTRAEKGVVDSFQGDHFVLTFNAVRAVGSPGRNGVLVGLSVEEGAQRDGLALGRFSMGLSVGRAHIGNVGSATMKKHCTVGSVYTNAMGLEQLAKRAGRTLALNGHLLSEVEVVAYCLMVGSVQLSDGHPDTLWSAMGRVRGAADEWLYEMEEAAKGNPYQAYNDAVQSLLQRDLITSTACLSDAVADLTLPEQTTKELATLQALVEKSGGVGCLNFSIQSSTITSPPL